LTDYDGSGLERVATGIGGLDTILQGGFPKGGMYLVQGTPGTGKTTLANQICFHHVAGGGRALYTTLLAEYHGRMMQHLSTMSFFDMSQIPDRLSYINGFGTLRQDSYPALRDLLRREITSQQASLLVLDGFATVQRQAPEQQDFNEFVHELQGIATATDCTMFLLSSAERVRETPEYTIVDGIVEFSDRTVGWSSESTLQVVKLRGTGFLRGRHAFQITSDGLAVYPRLEALLAKPSLLDGGAVVKVPSGIGRLDTMLGGGLPAASTSMVMGPTGAGKTTLGLQFLSCCSEGEPGLLVGFYETPARLAAKAAEVCRPFRGLLDSGVVEILWQPPTGGILDAYAELLLENVRRRGVRRLFLDGLGALQSVAANSTRMSHYLTALTNELRGLGVTTMYSLEAPEVLGSQVRLPKGELSLLSDNLILLRYIERNSRLLRLVSILKVRDSDFDPLLYEYVPTSEGLQIAEMLHAPGEPNRENDAAVADRGAPSGRGG